MAAPVAKPGSAMARECVRFPSCSDGYLFVMGILDRECRHESTIHTSPGWRKRRADGKCGTRPGAKAPGACPIALSADGEQLGPHHTADGAGRHYGWRSARAAGGGRGAAASEV